MSFGKKIEDVALALRREGKLPPGLRTVERNKRVLDRLEELGNNSNGLPSRWMLTRHLDRFLRGGRCNALQLHHLQSRDTVLSGTSNQMMIRKRKTR